MKIGSKPGKGTQGAITLKLDDKIGLPDANSFSGVPTFVRPIGTPYPAV